MPVKEELVEGLPGLVAKALDIAAPLEDARFLWFRGASSSNYKLQPKIMRDGKSSDEIFERERRLLTRFRQRSLPFWPTGYPQTDWEHLFAMQHFGLPTRLLDWSENLFVATHFALAYTNHQPDDDDDLPVVWCMDPVAWNRATPVLSEYGGTIQVLTTIDEELDAYRPETTKKRMKSPVAIFGTHNSSRIVAQRGTFVVWGNDTTAQEDYASGIQVDLWKLKITGDRDKLRRNMEQLGYGETMLFPELSSLAVELTRTEGWK
jgi:hypothetical protein